MIASLIMLWLHTPAHPLARLEAGRPAVQQVTTAATMAVRGMVHDGTGAVVAGAVVIVRSATAGERQTVTGALGEFTLPGFASGPFEIIVRMGGFAEHRQTVTPASMPELIDVVLVPATKSEEITVTPTRSEQRMGDVPASVSVLTRTDIRQSPAVVADDLLRQIPSFSLFRRTSSVAAHPATQGVSLRGIGPSGVSRTLVLLDGIPFNDPFGGWVYWSRVPLAGAERFEVIEGASSSLYGNYAMGGLINIVTSAPARRTIELNTQYGNLNSPKIDLHASDVWGKVGVTVDADVFDTQGYRTVYADEQGVVDTNSTVSFRNTSVKFDYAATDRVRAFVRAGHFREERHNGKITTFDPRIEEVNDTTWRSASAGFRMYLPDQSDVQASVFGDVETFHSNNVAVPNPVPRDVGRLSLQQTVPSKSLGGMVQWARPITGVHLLTAGVDWRWIDGDSEEQVFDATTGTTVTLDRVSGGTQRSVGMYFQDLITAVPRMTVTLSARLDRWRSYDGHNLERVVATGEPGPAHSPSLPVRRDTVASPRAAALYHLTDRLTVWGAVGAGFRAPTLNELYRGFRVGTTQTLANFDLGPERLIGSELGVNVQPWPGLVWRTTLFDNRVRHPISNVTLSQSGASVILQRQNLGRTRAWGVQTDLEYRIGTAWRVSGAYLFGESKVVEAIASPVLSGDDLTPSTLVGKYLPQVPRHRASVVITYANPRLANVVLNVQAIGRQFDDDQNARGVPGQETAGLPKYAVVGLSAARPLSRNLELFLTVQNLLDQQYFVGTLPTLVGPSRLASGGLRLSFRGR
jgi:outer membrane receptor protein involved in Fe transport